MVTTATDPIAQTNDPDDEGPGWASQWIRSDPARAVAALLILIQVVWRTKVSAGGFMVHDDFWEAMRSVEFGLTWDYLMTPLSNHLMPVPNLYIWWVTKNFGYAYWPYLTAMIVCQAVISIAFYRLLRLLIPATWGLLIPLSVFLFSPLNLESTSWWGFGMIMLPTELAMIWAMAAQVKFVRSRRYRHLVSLAAAVLFGLLFSEKVLLALPLLFGLTACLLVKGSPGRSIWRALTRYWQSWAILSVLAAGYIVLYQSLAHQPALQKPESAWQVENYFRQIFGENLIPGLLGGPWTWLEGTDVPLTTPSPMLKILALSAMVLFMAYTIWRRPVAGRAWILFIGYAFLATALIGATRLGGVLSWNTGRVTRYTSEIVIVAAIAIGVALFGVHNMPDRRPPRSIPWLSTPQGRTVARVAGATLAVILAVGTVITTSKYERAWANRPGDKFLSTFRTEMAKQPPGTVFFDQQMPNEVIAFIFYPYTLQSRFVGTIDKRPVFVKAAENPMVITGSGTIKPAFVMPARKTKPGPNGQCGYAIEGGGQTVTMPLDGPTVDWEWAFRIAYLSEGQTPVTVRFGKGTFEFTAQKGLHQYLFFIQGSSESVDVSVSAPGVGLCVTEITVGQIVPWLL